ncbi:MAG: c-type cytochrome [Bacteroidia bacterium]
MRKINLKSVISFLAVSAGVAAVITSCSSNQPTQENATTAPAADPFAIYYDGKGVGPVTEYKADADVKAVADSGKVIFESKCVSCHKLDETKLIGPGLAGITKIRRPEWIMNQILNPMEMTQKDSMSIALLKKYTAQMINMNLTEHEAGMVYEYLKANDAK